MHTYSICFQLFPFKHRLIADKTASFKVLQLRFACPVTNIYLRTIYYSKFVRVSYKFINIIIPIIHSHSPPMKLIKTTLYHHFFLPHITIFIKFHLPYLNQCGSNDVAPSSLNQSGFSFLNGAQGCFWYFIAFAYSDK